MNADIERLGRVIQHAGDECERLSALVAVRDLEIAELKRDAVDLRSQIARLEGVVADLRENRDSREAECQRAWAVIIDLRDERDATARKMEALQTLNAELVAGLSLLSDPAAEVHGSDWARMHALLRKAGGE